MSEVKSIQFPTTSVTQTGTATKGQTPISLRLGMEKNFIFVICGQEEGEQTVAAYINYTYSWYRIREQLEQILKTEKREGWEKAKKEEERIIEQIRLLQQNKIIIDFSKAVREAELRAKEKVQMAL